MTGIAGALLSRLVDYAGLFPPAGLSMADTVANYSAYQRRPDSWALGRLVVPVNRLGEFKEALARLPASDRPEGRWPISGLLGPDLAADRATLETFNQKHGGSPRVESLEVRVASMAQIADVRQALPLDLEVYCELPLTAELPGLVAAVKRAGLRAKVRTGGTNGPDIPAPEAVLAFVAACAVERLAFKATAGLHHPLRGSAPLTYEPNAACATMFGYLNLIMAASLLWSRRSESEALSALTVQDPDQVRFAQDGVEWDGSHIATQEIERTRGEFMIAIGSCSFTEPMGEIRQLGLDPAGFQLTEHTAGKRTAS